MNRKDRVSLSRFESFTRVEIVNNIWMYNKSEIQMLFVYFNGRDDLSQYK